MTTYRDLVFNVVSSSAPAWFTAINDGQWGTVASASNQKLDYVSPVVSGKRNSAITTAWTGGCVDQTRGEYILACNGGHGDYSGNEVYALALKTAAPAWARLNDPTPDGQLQGFDVAGAAVAVNADGKPRAVHGWHRCCFGDGKVWYVGQDSYAGYGDYAPYAVSFDRAALTWRTNYGRMPNAGTIGTGSAGAGGKAPAVYDRTRNRVWSYASFNPSSVSYLDCTTGLYSQSYQSIYGIITNSSWAVFAHDIDKVILGNTHWQEFPDTVGVMNPATGVFTRYPFTGGWSASGADGEVISNCAGPRLGAVYDPANKCVYVFDAGWTLGNVIKVLQIPASLGGTGASFAWRTHTPAGGATLTVGSQYRGTYSKFNIIEDMGGGKRALVCVTDTTGPTYVMPLPAGGL